MNQPKALIGSFTQAIGTVTSAIASIPSLSEKNSLLLIYGETYCKRQETP
ncbi:hypothetical protein [Anoxybacillus flavithermus]|nr:hypothetical protein [Anoxybacillus flavithermus]